MESKLRQKKMAIINDLSGYGRCSLTVQIPLISAFGIQACPVPTGIFSNHTGFESYVKKDLTDFLDSYIKEWVKLRLKFDGICIGYLTSSRQINIVKEIIRYCASDSTKIVLDPVMGDNGRLYSGYKKETSQALKEIVKHAEIITPNTTEACFLTDTDYDNKKSIREWEYSAKKLSDMGPEKVVITGINMGSFIGNLCYERQRDKFSIVRKKTAGVHRPGTGDIFSGIIAAEAVNDKEFVGSVKHAADFTAKCIKKSDELNIHIQDGVCFEELLRFK